MEHLAVNGELTKQKLSGKAQLFFIRQTLCVFSVNGVVIQPSLSDLKAPSAVDREQLQMPAGDKKCGRTFLGWLSGFVAVLITHLDNQRRRLRLRFDTELHFYVAK